MITYYKLLSHHHFYHLYHHHQLPSQLRRITSPNQSNSIIHRTRKSALRGTPMWTKLSWNIWTGKKHLHLPNFMKMDDTEVRQFKRKTLDAVEDIISARLRLSSSSDPSLSTVSSFSNYQMIQKSMLMTPFHHSRLIIQQFFKKILSRLSNKFVLVKYLTPHVIFLNLMSNT